MLLYCKYLDRLFNFILPVLVTATTKLYTLCMHSDSWFLTLTAACTRSGNTVTTATATTTTASAYAITAAAGSRKVNEMT
mmetsp:Transcript_15447/g.29146  ORF Transcript_15447/g.29146 Transcript_15447/m.29146 type:complete len:80 (+) Transcript_15447:122-361(+)